jgi:hypothetical protein
MKKLALLFAALFCMSGFTTTANAIGISIDVGDRPYYTYGPRYWARGAYWCWVPGHWAWRHHHEVWIHGHYGPC